MTAAEPEIRIEWGIRWTGTDGVVEVQPFADEDTARALHNNNKRQTVVIARKWTATEWREMTD